MYEFRRELIDREVDRFGGRRSNRFADSFGTPRTRCCMSESAFRHDFEWRVSLEVGTLAV